MKNTSLLNIAAIIAALTVLVITFILIPEPIWSAITIATAIGFAASVGYVFYTPSVFRQRAGSTDASQMSALGLLSTISLVLLLVTGGGFALALMGYQKLGLALLVFGLGIYVVMSLVVKATLNVVGNVSAKWAQPSQHFDWQNKVSMLVTQSTHKESQAELQSLVEKLRYSASDVPGGTSLDEEIEQLFELMSEKLKSDPATELKNQIDLINSKLAQRQVYLHKARSKA